MVDGDVVKLVKNHFEVPLDLDVIHPGKEAQIYNVRFLREELIRTGERASYIGEAGAHLGDSLSGLDVRQNEAQTPCR